MGISYKDRIWGEGALVFFISVFVLSEGGGLEVSVASRSFCSWGVFGLSVFLQLGSL